MTSTAQRIEVFGTDFQNPVLLAAGTAGFGREVAEVIDLTGLGGIVTKAVSPEPREGNRPPRVAEFSGGMINSVGLANPGLDHVASVDIPWLEANVGVARVIVNVVGSVPDHYAAVIRRLTAATVVAAFELNVSCPNTERGGEEFNNDPEVLRDVTIRCCDATSKPVIVKLTPNLEDLGRKAAVSAAAGASGITVINTLPGYLFDGAHKTARLGGGRGGVSGPALLPAGVLATTVVVAETGLPVIGVGGIRKPEDMMQYLEAGASLVAVGTAALAHPRVPLELAKWWARHA